ncbi:type VII secretion target [Nocardia sp. XZ_19_385]|uniref:type VII secretion target n=1 Tax=Nocardia sp. XZ_19_385 TaxID=2769488 RepID=UPI00188E6850|nr:hypothetical protein [Nocardia sp. XZ_19_385]
MAPTAQQISVAITAVRTQATGWAERSTTSAQWATDAATYRLTKLQGGIFFLMVEEYNAVISKLEERFKEAELSMKDIARTLNTAASVYEQEDQAREHELRNLY